MAADQIDAADRVGERHGGQSESCPGSHQQGYKEQLKEFAERIGHRDEAMRYVSALDLANLLGVEHVIEQILTFCLTSMDIGRRAIHACHA